MDGNGHEVIQLELKYCERCGGLWLRRQGVDKVFCGACAAEAPEYPLRPRKVTRPKLPIPNQSDIRRQFEVITTKGRGKGNA